MIIDFLKLLAQYALLPMCIAALLVPIVKRVGFALGIYAHENKRTVHKGKIVRVGGIAVFLSFMLCMAYFLSADDTINGILLGGTVVFIGGVLDDMLDLPPIAKLLFQFAGAIIAMTLGNVYLDVLNLPFNIAIDMGIVSKIVTFLWIVGVTNAINLIDGLDGLSSGVSIIVLITIAFIGMAMLNMGVVQMCLILAGATFGFWFYNFHPASIFMGDCGALFLGFTIACLSLLGFKTATVITLGFPIIILFVPILDTIVAIIRRKLKGDRISVGDREHLHHILMYKLNLGHRNAVLSLYVVTALFASCAIISYFKEAYGMILLIILTVAFEIFIEATEMINSKYHPLIGLCRRLTGYPKKKNQKNDI